MKNIIKRTTLFVRDMETSKSWYEDVPVSYTHLRAHET